MAKQLFTEQYDRTSKLGGRSSKPKSGSSRRASNGLHQRRNRRLYLNRYDFLNQAVGVKSAANIYFNKDVSELELHESAMLVGMLKNSSLFNPLRRPELVLNGGMWCLGKCSATAASPTPKLTRCGPSPGVELPKSQPRRRLAPYFREALRAN